MSFQPAPWVCHTNIYEVNLRQFTAEGTFHAFARHLPRLKDMGVQTLWFMPLHPIGKSKRLGSLGSYYSISDHKAVNPEFGTLKDFQWLVQVAHDMGFKILMDWVANHTAWDHVWTASHPHFYIKDENGFFTSPYDWEDVIQLDHSNAAQQEAMLDAMQFWLTACDIDGFRCDMAHLTPLAFWKKARTKLDGIKPLFWLAETEEPEYQAVFDAIYTWTFLHTMEAYWRKEKNLPALLAVLEKYESECSSRAMPLFFTSNHDENSHSGSEYERMGEAALPFAVLCAVWKGIPLVYSGQEQPVMRRLNFYNKDAIQWTGTNRLHDFYKNLLQLHASHPALNACDEETKPQFIHSGYENVLAFLRKKASAEVLVILNLSDLPLILHRLYDEKISGHYKNIFTGEVINFSQTINWEMKKWDYAVLIK
jgi:glycosidase